MMIYIPLFPYLNTSIQVDHVPFCDVRIKTMFGSSSPPVVCGMAVFVFACVSYCVVFFVFSLLCALYWLPLRYSLTFTSISYRLTPPYMLIMMVYIPLFPYLGSGPMWAKDGTELNYCKDSWWYNLLYINNFRTIGEQVCIPWVTESSLILHCRLNMPYKKCILTLCVFVGLESWWPT